MGDAPSGDVEASGSRIPVRARLAAARADAAVRERPMGALVLAAIICAMAAWPTYLLVAETLDVLACSRATEGVVLATRVDEVGTKFVPRVRYAYTVGATRFESDRVTSLGDRSWSDPVTQLRAYSVSAKVTVHYDPSEPGRAVLERGWLTFVLGICVALWGFALIVPMALLSKVRRRWLVPAWLTLMGAGGVTALLGLPVGIPLLTVGAAGWWVAGLAAALGAAYAWTYLRWRRWRSSGPVPK